MLGITTLEHVETGRRYILDKRLSEEEVRFITETLLYNPVIQNYVLHNSAIQNDIFNEPVDAITHFDKSIPSPVGADYGGSKLNVDYQRSQRQHTSWFHNPD